MPILLEIRGNRFRGIEDQTRYAALVDGEPLTLVPEPTNQYDPNAIKVMSSEGHHLGYVPKEDCLDILSWIDEAVAKVYREDKHDEPWMSIARSGTNTSEAVANSERVA